MAAVPTAANDIERGNGTGRRQQRGDRLAPRFLNGHRVAWTCTQRPVGATSNRDVVDAPPAHVSYEPGNVVFTRMQMAGDRAFIVSPRYRPGVPFTLSYVLLTDCRTSEGRNPAPCNGDVFHPVSPYPSLRAHCQFSKSSAKSHGGERTCDNEGLVNVVDAYLGPDGVLWVLDVGVINTLAPANTLVKPKKYTEPKVVGIDVATGRTVHKIELKTLLPFDGDFGDEKAKITGRSLHTIAVEYEDDESAGDGSGSPATVPKQVDQSPGTTAGDGPGPSGSAPVDGHDDDRGNRRPARRNREKPARPVAVYVGDATDGGPDRGSFVAWSVRDARGIRVRLPVSVSAARGPGGTGDYADADDPDAERNMLHLALLDESRPAGQVVRHLYITYGRHPYAYKIPVNVIRDRRRGANDDRSELRLTKCGVRGCGTGGIRCLVNVGRKPVGPDRRPLVPIDSVYGRLWYYRGGTSAHGSDLYVWDSRKPFHAEHFRRVGGDDGPPSVRKDCSCGDGDEEDAGAGGDRPRQPRLVTKGLRPRDDGNADGVASRGGRASGGGDKDDDETGESRDALNKTATAGRQPVRGRAAWIGCMQITSVDYSSWDPVANDASSDGYGTLWTFRSNFHDSIRGRTGRFGPIALLSPFTSDCNL
ncbi:Major royal jelly protein/protein yellow [Cinara cedri]|uniref:Major royal jelly protein/protein yellow n=1 Tax=Cinara cedri TaxID=506608 RepID=A0A5E4N297_9HEMI|nr:Major royal jelly protein/protein yellow [Cinara cedri]